MEYSALKKEVLSHAVIWVTSEYMLSETAVKRDTYCMTPLIWGIWHSQIIETQSAMIVTKGWGRGIKGNHCIMGTECQFHETRRVLEMLHNNVNILNSTELYTQKWFKWGYFMSFFFTTFFKKLNRVPYDLIIPLLSILKEKWKRMSTQNTYMKVWQQHYHNTKPKSGNKCPSIDEWTKCDISI